MPARSRARKRALDVLFEADQRGVDPVALVGQRLASGAAPVPEFAVALVEGVAAHRERIDEVLAAVQALCPNVRYEVEPGEPPHSKTAPLDISAAKRHLGWEPQFTLQSAFEDYLTELKAARATKS